MNTTVLQIDALLCLVYSLVMMFSPQVMTYVYLSIPHSDGLGWALQFWGLTLLSICAGSHWVIKLNNEMVSKLFIRTRSLFWIMAILFKMYHYSIYNSSMFGVTFLTNLTMALLTTYHSDWFNYARASGSM